ncbi:MAG: hypothetical protein CME86_06450 [Herbaspirillum sp.]|nr:hypothetical protein [Herbaspirillum sp.]
MLFVAMETRMKVSEKVLGEWIFIQIGRKSITAISQFKAITARTGNCQIPKMEGKFRKLLTRKNMLDRA